MLALARHLRDFMKGVVSGAILLIIAIIIGLVFLAAIFGFGGTAQGLQKPGTGFFETLDKLFGFFEQRVFLASQETKDFFCEKPLNDALELCNVKSADLTDYCNSDPDTKITKCESASDGLKKFCSQEEKQRNRICQDPRQFYSFCDQLKQTKDIENIATASGALALKSVTQIILCK